MRKILLIWALIICVVTLPISVVAQDYENLFRDFKSADLSRADKRFLQTALAFEGHYNGLLDGSWGPLSQKAFEEYSRQEFGSAVEDWHMATLAFSFFDIYERDGWSVRYLDSLGMSILHPFRAVQNDASSEYFSNWQHKNSSLAYSAGIHQLETTSQFHEYTWNSHSSSTEPYSLRQNNLAITTAMRSDGGVLYTRSNYINGAWSTVMLSANRRDVPILNAVAGSITVGRSEKILFSENGKLAQVIRKAIDYVETELPDPSSKPQVSSNQPSEIPQHSSGTGFVVSAGGHVLTNSHVIEGCSLLKFDGKRAAVVANSVDLDLALLRVEGWDGKEIATFSPSPARLNSDVTVVGYPLAGILMGLNVTRGSVSSQMGFGGEVTGMQITAPVQSGNSGGPVLAPDGEVVGVVVSKLNAQVVADATGDMPQNVNFAIRGEIAKLFLFQHGVEPILGEGNEPIASVDLAELAAGFTGFIECN